MCNYFLIPMDFNYYNFAKARTEYEAYKHIAWEVAGTPKKRAAGLIIDPKAKMPNLIKQGDVIYFYIHHLPSEGQKNKARILLRGVVKDAPHIMKRSEIYLSQESSTDEYTIGMTICNLSTFTKEGLENDNLYSREMISEIYGQSYPQGNTFWPNSYDKNLDPRLIEALENSFKKSDISQDFNGLIAHFSRPCFFLDKWGSKSDHKTFVRRNGTDYYELHHFIPRHSTGKIQALKPVVDDETNLIYLCSNCHNRLHYGRPKEINQLLALLWNDEAIQEMFHNNRFYEILGASSEEQALEWLHRIYNTNE